MKRRDAYDSDYQKRRLEGERYTDALRRDLEHINGINHIYKCEHCGVEHTLNMFDLHHVIPIADGGDAMGEVVILCKKCHTEVHGRVYHGDKPKPVIEKDDWVKFAQQKFTQKDIVVELNTTAGEISKAWNRDGRGLNWSQFKKRILKGYNFEEAVGKHTI